jgi:hypothetical protein
LASERSPTARGNQSEVRPIASCAAIKINGAPRTAELPGGRGMRLGMAKKKGRRMHGPRSSR